MNGFHFADEPGDRGWVAGQAGVSKGGRYQHPVSKANFADNKSSSQTEKEGADSGEKILGRGPADLRGQYQLYALYSNCQYQYTTPSVGVTGYAHVAFDSLWLCV